MNQNQFVLYRAAYLESDYRLITRILSNVSVANFCGFALISLYFQFVIFCWYEEVDMLGCRYLLSQV